MEPFVEKIDVFGALRKKAPGLRPQLAGLGGGGDEGHEFSDESMSLPSGNLT